ncbi:MAG: succinate dehydrogenase, hydrophobic membrane anchor protein [Rhizobiaceae bacterium]|nr:succinate dehydrogenase, hydrophobic membrane anchor protein [Rhizobiaceae bacterium]
MSMLTPLKKVNGLGSAREGTDHFWRQRLTSIANVPLLLYFIWLLISLNGASYTEVIAELSSPFTTIVLLLVMVSGLVHMKLGMQSVIEDYVHNEGTKIAWIIGNTFFTYCIGAISIFAILKLGFGG